jgi:hypothetical protein
VFVHVHMFERWVSLRPALKTIASSPLFSL